MLELNLIQKIVIAAVPLIMAIVGHELAHGLMANRLGDPTPKIAGRLSLNPLVHIDLVGTLILPLLLLALNAPVLGFAKPVPFDSHYFKNPRRDAAWVALAGPLANLSMALFWALLLKLLQQPVLKTQFTLGLEMMAFTGILINISLLILNLIPVLPLDGGRVLLGFLPAKLALRYALTERYGFLILVVLLFSGVLNVVIGPLIAYFTQVICLIFKLPS